MKKGALIGFASVLLVMAAGCVGSSPGESGTVDSVPASTTVVSSLPAGGTTTTTPASTSTTGAPPSTVAASTSSTNLTTTSRPSLPTDQDDRQTLTEATKDELRATGIPELVQARVAQVDLYGDWAVTSIEPPPGYERGYVLFRRSDEGWVVVVGLTHQFILTRLAEDGVPQETIDTIKQRYATSPE